MKNLRLHKLFLIAGLFFFVQMASAQNPQNWTDKQLMSPAALAQTIKEAKDVPLIISVGPGATIPNSVNIGMVSEEEKLAALKAKLAELPKNSKVVVYCGCCPFAHCPNVRPAIAALQQMKFTNYYLLDLPNNLKKDWIDKGYPTVK